jgi:hypothetical protein
MKIIYYFLIFFEQKSMVYDCRGTSGHGETGSGPNGGQGGTSFVETKVDAVSSI